MPEGLLLDLTVVVLTKDEARHVERCIGSVAGLAARVLLVDSGSSDDTQALARAAGADVVEHPFSSHAAQFNWALDNAGIATAWVFRLDADEVVRPELARALRDFLAAPGAAVGATVNRRMHFLGRWLRWGGIYPVRTLRLFKSGHGRVEDRWMDEHVLVDGPVVHLAGDIADINLNGIGWWTDKHNRYATLEAIETLRGRSEPPAGLARQARVKRWTKQEIYGRLPLGARALLYFFYRYVVRLGFLDGWQGLVYCALQGGWYRFLVDVKVRELSGLMAARRATLAEVVRDEHGLTL